MPNDVIRRETNGTRKNRARYASPGTSRTRAMSPPRRRSGSRAAWVPAGTRAEIAISGGLSTDVHAVGVRRALGLGSLDTCRGVQAERVLPAPRDPDLGAHREDRAEHHVLLEDGDLAQARDPEDVLVLAPANETSTMRPA